jgi:hypothetical protein
MDVSIHGEREREREREREINGIFASTVKIPIPPFGEAKYH